MCDIIKREKHYSLILNFMAKGMSHKKEAKKPKKGAKGK